MKRFLWLIAILLTAPMVVGQNRPIDSYAARLAKPSELGASVKIRTDAPSSAALAGLRAPLSRLHGMKVCIYFDNGQNARAGASAALSKLKSLYPNLRGDVVYQNPFFKAIVGECVDRVEAARLLGILKASFPDAIIVNDAVDVSRIVMGAAQVEVDPFLPAVADSTAVLPSVTSDPVFERMETVEL